MKRKNLRFTWAPKWVSPFGDKEVYLVPAVKDQQGDEWNYVCVCCSPTMNGLYKWPRQNAEYLQTWCNHGKQVYYVPTSICEYVKPLDKIEMLDVKKKVYETQLDWWEYTKPKKYPLWILNSEGLFK